MLTNMVHMALTSLKLSQPLVNIYWINNFVLQSMGMQLAKYDLAKFVLDHLKMYSLFLQNNTSWKLIF